MKRRKGLIADVCYFNKFEVIIKMDSGVVKVKWASSLGKNWRCVGKQFDKATNKVDYYSFSLAKRKNTLR